MSLRVATLIALILVIIEIIIGFTTYRSMFYLLYGGFLRDAGLALFLLVLFIKQKKSK